MNDLISRQDAIGAIVNTPTDVYSHDRIVSVLDGAAFRQNEIIDIINALPSAQQELLDDGTLMMTVPHGMLNDVKRVLVDEVGTKNCKVMYQDEQQPEHDGWIPTKITKPPKAGQYLVTKQQKTGVCQIATAHYNPSFDEWSGNGNFTKVLAWQRLPSPYTQE